VTSHANHRAELQALQAESQWKRGFPMQELTDATLLIIGAGGIGQAIAFLDNFNCYQTGQLLRNVVDKQTGY